MRKVDLLIFDLDGTLIDSKWDIAQSVNVARESLGGRKKGVVIKIKNQ